MLFHVIQPFGMRSAGGAGGTPTPPAIAAGYSTTFKGGKVQLLYTRPLLLQC